MALLFDWNGDEVEMRFRRATGRGLIGIGEAVSTEGKRNAHVISGTMRRSVHTAKADYTGGNDEEDASGGQDLQDSLRATEVTRRGTSDIIQVGSWVAYACVEEVGRGHAFMQPAVEAVTGPRSEALMGQAFAEEGFVGV